MLDTEFVHLVLRSPESQCYCYLHFISYSKTFKIWILFSEITPSVSPLPLRVPFTVLVSSVTPGAVFKSEALELGTMDEKEHETFAFWL